MKEFYTHDQPKPKEHPGQLYMDWRGKADTDMPSKELAFLRELAMWKNGMRPSFPDLAGHSATRSAIVRRRGPLLFPDGSKGEQVQMKGVGFCTQEGKYGHPSDKGAYLREGISGLDLEVDEVGNLQPKFRRTSPLGGLLAGRGEIEFNNLRKAYEAGILVPRALDWATLRGKNWQGQKLEALILISERTRGRVGALIHEMFRDPQKTDEEIVEAVLASSKEISEITMALQKEAGLVNLQPHQNNFSQREEAENGKNLVAHDLETAKSVEGMTHEQVARYVLLDLVRLSLGLFKFWNNMTSIRPSLSATDAGKKMTRESYTAYLGAPLDGTQTQILNKLSDVIERKVNELQRAGLLARLLYGEIQEELQRELLPLLCDFYRTSALQADFPLQRSNPLILEDLSGTDRKVEMLKFKMQEQGVYANMGKANFDLNKALKLFE